MNKIRNISKLTSVLLIYLMNSGCSSEDANAESPCPTSFNSSEIRVLDSITGIEVTTAEVIIAGNIYDNTTKEYANSEVIFNFNAEVGSYGFQYSHDGIEIDQRDVIIYTIDDSYNSNVTKPQEFGCTNLESTIYLCPNGSACR